MTTPDNPDDVARVARGLTQAHVTALEAGAAALNDEGWSEDEKAKRYHPELASHRAHKSRASMAFEDAKLISEVREAVRSLLAEQPR